METLDYMDEGEYFTPSMECFLTFQTKVHFNLSFLAMGADKHTEIKGMADKVITAKDTVTKDTVAKDTVTKGMVAKDTVTKGTVAKDTTEDTLIMEPGKAVMEEE